MNSNYQAGHSAELRAAEYLKQQSYKIHELNWKTKYCEIDIVAQKNNAIYFVEVKYRKTDKQGYGLDYITPKKLKQMRFAAEMWVSANHWKNEYQLAAIGIDKDVITFVDEL
jgi:ribonuclease HII